MNKRIRNKKAKQRSIKLADQFSKIRTIEPIGFYKELSENNKFKIVGQITAYFSNPELSKMMQEKHNEWNDFYIEMIKSTQSESQPPS